MCRQKQYWVVLTKRVLGPFQGAELSTFDVDLHAVRRRNFTTAHQFVDRHYGHTLKTLRLQPAHVAAVIFKERTGSIFV